MSPGATSGISRRFQRFSPPQGQVAHVFLALPPLSRADIATFPIPFDLHAYSTLPAFVLSQNQTLRKRTSVCWSPSRGAGTTQTSICVPPPFRRLPGEPSKFGVLQHRLFSRINSLPLRGGERGNSISNPRTTRKRENEKKLKKQKGRL